MSSETIEQLIKYKEKYLALKDIWIHCLYGIKQPYEEFSTYIETYLKQTTLTSDDIITIYEDILLNEYFWCFPDYAKTPELFVKLFTEKYNSINYQDLERGISTSILTQKFYNTSYDLMIKEIEKYSKKYKIIPIPTEYSPTTYTQFMDELATEYEWYKNSTA
jgi:hypothetical protein